MLYKIIFTWQKSTIKRILKYVEFRGTFWEYIPRLTLHRDWADRICRGDKHTVKKTPVIISDINAATVNPGFYVIPSAIESLKPKATASAKKMKQVICDYIWAAVIHRRIWI